MVANRRLGAFVSTQIGVIPSLSVLRGQLGEHEHEHEHEHDHEHER
jgi:hypothetical protein